MWAALDFLADTITYGLSLLIIGKGESLGCVGQRRKPVIDERLGACDKDLPGARSTPSSCHRRVRREERNVGHGGVAVVQCFTGEIDI